MKQFLFFLSVLLCATFSINSTIINVPGDYSTIQSAINASDNGDTVLVAPGTYTENINFRGKRIVLTSQYYMTNNPATIYATIIDGNNPSNPDSGSCVIFNRGEDSTTVLQGFAITRGTGTKWNDEHAAGLYREGGGILVALSSPIIKNNIIYNNQVTNLTGVASTGGGGVRIGDCYVRFYDNIVMNNTARYGAGMVLNYTGGEYKNNIICSNYGSNQFQSGSGMWINSVNMRPKLIINNTIAGNSAPLGIAGVYSNSAITFKNNIVWGNSSPVNFQISPSMGVTYSNIQGGYSGAGNINADPMFADSNYVLLPGSPCVDKGDSSVVYNDLPDPNNPQNAKYPSRGGLRNDMGAYGGPLALILSGQLIGIPVIGIELPVDFALYQNYPNPFNPATNITFDLPKNNFVTLKLFDITGREILTLINGYKNAGRHEVSLNALELSSGIYFYKLESGSFSASKKMVLAK